MVAGNLRRRSIFTYKISLMSNSKSTQEPRSGIIRAEKRILPLTWDLPLSCEKNAPGERCIWLTMTRSTPFIINVPVGPIIGISPRNIFCSLTSLTVLTVTAGTFSASKTFNTSLVISVFAGIRVLEAFGRLTSSIIILPFKSFSERALISITSRSKRTSLTIIFIGSE